MNANDKKLAIEIISESNSPKVSFGVPISGSYSRVYEILIHECNANLINKLIANGFYLSMNENGMSVDKF